MIIYVNVWREGDLYAESCRKAWIPVLCVHNFNVLLDEFLPDLVESTQVEFIAQLMSISRAQAISYLQLITVDICVKKG